MFLQRREKFSVVCGLVVLVLEFNFQLCWFCNVMFAFLLQDLGLAQNTATNTKTPVPLGSLAHQIYRMMCARGYANKDFSSVFQFLREEEGQ